MNRESLLARRIRYERELEGLLDALKRLAARKEREGQAGSRSEKTERLIADFMARADDCRTWIDATDAELKALG